MIEFIDESRKDNIEYKWLYTRYAKPLIIREALFADCTSEYLEIKKNSIRIKFRTACNNVDSVFLCMGDRKIQMKKTKKAGAFDYYFVEIDRQEQIRYYFEIVSGKLCMFYSKRGVESSHYDYYDFKVNTAFRTPDWAKGAIFYQIFVDRFCNGDPSNDVEDREYTYIQQYSRRVTQWDALPEANDVCRFYGGDLQGVMDKLDYLEDLGVQVIYLNPIFVSPSNHKYDCQDYDYIDPHYGKIVYDEGKCLEDGDMNNIDATRYISRVTDFRNLEASNALFAKLTEEIHKRGMRIILDGVFNHCGSFNKWMDREKIYDTQEGYEKGAYVSESSPYRSFFKFNSEQWPDNGDYNGWWGHDTLPKLNYEESEALQSYILGIAEKWLKPPYNIDGWRLDVAADLGFSQEFNHEFWKKFRKTVKAVNPDALILAEHYGDPGAWLQGDEWDTVMNYDAFMEPVTWMFTGMEKHSDEYRPDLLGNAEVFESAMSHHMSVFQGESLYTAMNELSNHDHSRFLTRTNHRVGRIATVGSQEASENLNYGIFRAAVLLQMTWPGAPTVYYGDEAGVCGWTDPDNRRTYPWGHEDMTLVEYHKDVIRIHRQSKALIRGSYKFLRGGDQWLSFCRFYDNDIKIIVINNSSESKEIRVPVWVAGAENGTELFSKITTYEKGYHLKKDMYAVQDGYITVVLQRYSACLLSSI